MAFVGRTTIGHKARRRLVVEALPEHRHAKETGSAESLEGRIDFFEVAA
jgi:hypothetical protein